MAALVTLGCASGADVVGGGAPTVAVQFHESDRSPATVPPWREILATGNDCLFLRPCTGVNITPVAISKQRTNRVWHCPQPKIHDCMLRPALTDGSRDIVAGWLWISDLKRENLSFIKITKLRIALRIRAFPNHYRYLHVLINQFCYEAESI
jgi:hypothetical protein